MNTTTNTPSVEPRKPKRPFFNMTKVGNVIGDGSAGDLFKFIIDFIHAVFPHHRIEKFYNADQTANGLKSTDKIASTEAFDTGIKNFACYVRHDGEAQCIEFAVVRRNQSLQQIGTAYTHDDADTCWLMAQAVSTALDSIYFWWEIPEIGDIFKKIPATLKNPRTRTESIVLRQTAHALTVSTSGGAVLDDRQWKCKGANARFYVTAALKDWSRLLDKLNIHSVVLQESHCVIPDLPGYLLTNRGMDSLTGYYVLPPKGNPDMDGDYIGYFNNAEDAVCASLNHKNGRDVPMSGSCC